MKLPIQTQPVNRQVAATKLTSKGIVPSVGCCGPGNLACYGLCINGYTCLGVCA
ncbi:hypothetical protein A0J48_016685 [Sphaerospermopsis aphanizomenoides BCCUSP55]|uniref:hypothetical protein n=1 Tax=Sphaerospermopsis aphanizomenoides TaxID=459663 RepID=UPI001907701C|nr:hypothetical protein [Sphaerospermopsis aphanizomenoides]MBK1989156.1 hypothetical protein [Sphaerospermopsis aphanizomenoides BCCUSP55]